MSASLICGWLGWHWSAANYLVDQDGAAKVRIYETEGVADGDGHYRQSSVSVINEHGRDVTNRFDITISGKAVRAQATAVYLAMVSAMPNQEVGWRAYLQCRCLVTVGRHENRFTEYYQDRVIPSNTVWTRTPDLTPGLHLEKFDVASGFPDGDRDEPNQALPVNGNIDMVFRITNDSGKDLGTGRGALFRARNLSLEDWTVTGSGRVVDLKYPQGWNDLILKPGQSVDVHGTLV